MTDRANHMVFLNSVNFKKLITNPIKNLKLNVFYPLIDSKVNTTSNLFVGFKYKLGFIWSKKATAQGHLSLMNTHIGHAIKFLLLFWDSLTFKWTIYIEGRPIGRPLQFLVEILLRISGNPKSVAR